MRSFPSWRKKLSDAARRDVVVWFMEEGEVITLV